MGSFFLRGVFKVSVLFLTLDLLAQKDSVSNPGADTGPNANKSFPPTIKVAANPQLKGNSTTRYLIGTNYRDEWVTPVEVPVLRLRDAYGGLVPTKEGGGKQTKSLRVANSEGREWALRSVEKFPEKAVPDALRGTVAEKLVEDGISASYPYGILSMPILSEAANVLYYKDSLVYLPDDPALGEFRSKYRHTLMLMEEKEPSGFITKIKGAKREKTIDTYELLYSLSNSNKIKVDKSAILRARLLDNFIMDFDRHFNQWDWVGVDSADEKTYYPVPADRDQAFYLGTGKLLRMMTGKSMLPQLQGFKEKAKDVTTFNLPEQGFDRFFLNGLSEEMWSRHVDDFLLSMTDSVIENAMRQQPGEIQKYSVEQIITTLKNKRLSFKDDMMEYYRFLSKTVSVAGTNGRDQFSISKSASGVVTLTVQEIDSAGNLAKKLYERVFDPNLTRELIIYGLEGDDKFVLDGGKSGFDIKIIGGPGNDEYVNNGDAGKVFVYDVSYEQNSFSGEKSLRKRISGDPLNNRFRRLGYQYDRASVGPAIEYSIGGLFLGALVNVKNHAFRKDPYASTHLISVARAVDVSSYHLKYYADFIKVFGKTDLLFRGDGFLPSARTFFYGIGNNTVFDKSKGHKYYFAHYNLITASLKARNWFNSWWQISYGPVFQYFKLKTKPNENKYVSEVYPDHDGPGLDYVGKSYGGGEVSMEINRRNDQVLTTRGIRLNMYGRTLTGIGKYGNPVTEAGGQLDLYTDFISKKHVVIATSFGGSHITGNFEFEQAQYLGFKQNLRGFRIDRFAGRSRAYNNSEIRFMRPDANLGLFRATIGLFAFNDVARVWADNEQSDQWHDGYGWGIFIAPLDRVVVTAALMYSKEEANLLSVNFGFQF